MGKQGIMHIKVEFNQFLLKPNRSPPKSKTSLETNTNDFLYKLLKFTPIDRHKNYSKHIAIEASKTI